MTNTLGMLEQISRNRNNAENELGQIGIHGFARDENRERAFVDPPIGFCFGVHSRQGKMRLKKRKH